MTTTATPPVRPVTPIRPRWGGGRVALLVVGAVLAFFGANLLKIATGGYVPVILASVLIVIMWTWVKGTGILFETTHHSG